MAILTVDIETYSEVDINREGLNKYATHPSTKIIIGAIKKWDKPTKVYDCTKHIEEEVFKFLLGLIVREGHTIICHNAAFEVALFKNVYGIEFDFFKVHDTALFGRYLNFKEVSLEAMSGQIGDVKKMKEGKDLIKIFSTPSKTGLRILPENFPAEWELFKEYCGVDVDSTRSIYNKLINLIPETELFLQSLTLWQNETGLRINDEFLQQALLIEKLTFEDLSQYVTQELKIPNPRSLTQIKSALKARYYDVASLSKDNIPSIIATYPELKTLIEAIATLNSKTSAKFHACEKLMIDNVVRYPLVYCGAVTGRWSSKGLQIHNFSNKPVAEEVKEKLINRDYAGLTSLDQINNAVRALIVPRKGHKFVVADYSQIEARLMAAYANEQWKIEVFNTTGLIYEEAAARMFNITAESCRKGNENAPRRQDGKVCELALQYGGGWSAIVKQIGDEERSKDLVNRWRQANSNIQEYRKEIMSSCYEALSSKNSFTHNNGLVKIKNTPMGLCIRLESILGYRHCFIPNLKPVEQVERFSFADDEGNPITSIGGIKISGKLYRLLLEENEFTYNNKLYSKQNNMLTVTEVKSKMVVDKTTFFIEDNSYNQRTVINSLTHKRFEHINPIIQGVARDCLGHAMRAITLFGYPPLFHVHDELIVECLDEQVDEVCELLKSIMDFDVLGVNISAKPEVMTYYTK